MKIQEIFVFISLFSALSMSLGFTANRTEWSTVPQLKPRPQVSVEVLMKDVQAKGIDDALRSSEVKKSLKLENVTMAESPLREKSNPENQTDFLLQLIDEPKLRFNRQEKFIKGRTNNGPLNVILLLIDGLDQNEENLQMNLENFPIQGFWQTCPEKRDLSPESVYFAERNADCDCDAALRSNVASLLSWAQHIKEMSTSALYEMPTVYSRKIEMDSQSFMSPQVRRIDRQLSESWQLNDAKRSKLSEAPATPIIALTESRARKDDSHDDEGLRHVSSVLSRLREAFFRTLLSSLSGSSSSSRSSSRSRVERPGQDDEYRRSFPPRRSSNFRELAARTLEELNSMPNERGYVLVATTGVHELLDALELFRRYVSPLETLLVVTSTCPRDQSSPAPFFARGPGSEYLAAVNPISLHELPSVIRGIIGESRECRESANDCDGEPRGKHEDVVLVSGEPVVLGFGGPILMYDEEEMPRERFARDERAENATHEKFERSEKVPEAKEAQGTKLTGIKRNEKRNEKSKPKEVPLDVSIQLRMGPDTPAKNCQEIHSHSTIILMTIVTIAITHTLCATKFSM